jgi:hypothetical protein
MLCLMRLVGQDSSARAHTVRLDTVLGLTRVPHRASVMSSTRRTEIPAKYISISASSTELYRRR